MIIQGEYDPDVPVELPTVYMQSPPNFSKLVEYVTDAHADASSAEWREPKDFEHYVYELAMEAIYGKGYWDWLNPRLDKYD